MRRNRRIAAIGLLAMAFGTISAPAALARTNPAPLTFEVTVTNLTESQWFTPPAAATHTRRFDAFSVGRPASEGIRQIAENGDLGPFTAALDSSRAVYDWVVAPASEELPPLAPGESVTFTIESSRGARLLSYASMLICTNDGFTGADGLRLPTRIGHTTTDYGRAYDAGTEVNTEAWADLVPPCAQLTGFGDQGGTGASNPELAENGKVRVHRGISGSGDLTPSIHGWSEPVSKIEVTRIG
ncbi:MAG: spondin domain-containing protein [Acidimicrobiia bacterium]